MRLGGGRFLADALLSVILPWPCAVCGDPVDSLADGITCAACWASLEGARRSPRCLRCQALTSTPSAQCPACREMVLDRLWFIGPYEGVLRAHLLFLKRQPYVCQRLREKIRETLRQEPALQDVEVILAVPLHPRRLRERGYNQARLLAQEVARTLGRPEGEGILHRVKYTEPHRAGADAVARARSVADCFAVALLERIRGRIVLLVDDVYTSGATLNECARVVRRAGARAVYGFVIARTVSDAPGNPSVQRD